MFHDFVSSSLYFFGHGYFSCFCMDLCPSLSLFFQYIAHAFAGENFGKRLYDIWNIKKDMHEWMVWKCYSSGVEVLANGGGVYMILDHESMKRNSQRSQKFGKAQNDASNM